MERFSLSESEYPPIRTGEMWSVTYSPVLKGFVHFEFDDSASSAQTHGLSLAALGKRTFEQYSCGTCHPVARGDSSLTRDGVGPSLAGWAGTDRPLEGGRSETADAVYLKMSVVAPSSARALGYSGASMPSYEGQLDPTQLDALWAYVACLSDVEPEGGCEGAESRGPGSGAAGTPATDRP